MRKPTCPECGYQSIPQSGYHCESCRRIDWHPLAYRYNSFYGNQVKEIRPSDIDGIWTTEPKRHNSTVMVLEAKPEGWLDWLNPGQRLTYQHWLNPSIDRCMCYVELPSKKPWSFSEINYRILGVGEGYLLNSKPKLLTANLDEFRQAVQKRMGLKT
jgi:hypothetical protein